MRSRPGEIRVGVIGAGVIATTTHIPVLQNIDGVRIAWVADATLARAEKVASLVGTRPVQADGIAAALADCDVVLLSIPLMPRAHYFEMLADRAVTVLSEKPLALSAADHRRFAGRFGPERLSICYARRFNGSSRVLRRLMADRVLGVPRAIRVREGGPTTRTGGLGTYQDESRDRGGGITLNLACHALDCVVWITQARRYSIRKREIEWDGDTDRRLRAEVMLHDLDGKAGEETVLDIVVTNLDTVANTMELEFDGATVRCPIAPGERCDLVSKGAPAGIELVSTEGARNSLESYYQMWSDVLSSHREGRASVVSGTSSVLMAELMDELLQR